MKYSKRIFILMAVIVLVFLYVLSSTDWILKEQENKIYNISVITNDVNDASFTNYRNGTKQALKEWTADVNFVSLYEKNNVEQQMELILREIQNGAQAIVVFPIDGEKLTELLEERAVNVPVVYVTSRVESEKVSVCIHTDDYERGVQMAEILAESLQGKNGKVFAFTQAGEGTEPLTFYKGLKEAGAEKGIEVALCNYREEIGLEQKVATALLNKDNILLALDVQTLDIMLRKYKEEKKIINEIYGNGYSNYILNHLSKKTLSGVAVHNDYDIGYLSMKAAIMLLMHENVSRDIPVESFIVLPEDVYTEQYEKILFPL